MFLSVHFLEAVGGSSLWDRTVTATVQPWMHGGATDRGSQACFVKWRFLELLGRGEVSNGLLPTSNVFTACTQQPQWKLPRVIKITLTETVVQTLFLQPEIPQVKASPPGGTQRCNEAKTGVFSPDLQTKTGYVKQFDLHILRVRKSAGAIAGLRELYAPGVEGS